MRCLRPAAVARSPDLSQRRARRSRQHQPASPIRPAARRGGTVARREAADV